MNETSEKNKLVNERKGDRIFFLSGTFVCRVNFDQCSWTNLGISEIFSVKHEEFEITLTVN